MAGGASSLTGAFSFVGYLGGSGLVVIGSANTSSFGGHNSLTFLETLGKEKLLTLDSSNNGQAIMTMLMLVSCGEDARVAHEHIHNNEECKLSKQLSAKASTCGVNSRCVSFYAP